jgi:hypothetical protein
MLLVRRDGPAWFAGNRCRSSWLRSGEDSFGAVTSAGHQLPDWSPRSRPYRHEQALNRQGRSQLPARCLAIALREAADQLPKAGRVGHPDPGQVEGQAPLAESCQRVVDRSLQVESTAHIHVTDY